MTKKNAAPSPKDVPSAEPGLDSRYGAIGISAVAAAVEFQSEAKNPAYAPVAHKTDKRLADTAA